MRTTRRTSVFLQPYRHTAGRRWQAASLCLAMLVFVFLLYAILPLPTVWHACVGGNDPDLMESVGETRYNPSIMEAGDKWIVISMMTTCIAFMPFLCLYGQPHPPKQTRRFRHIAPDRDL